MRARAKARHKSVVTDVSEDDRTLHTEITSEIRKRQVSSSENFDKSVLTLSSGGLAFSLGFLKDFVPINKAVGAWVLYTSWGGLTAATCLTMISFLVAAKSQDFQQALANAYYLQGDESAFTRRNPWDRATIWLNRVSGACFFVGVVLTTAFVAINLTRAQEMTDAKRTTANDGLPAPQLLQKVGPTEVQRGLPAPTMTAKLPTQPQSTPASAAPATPLPATTGQGPGK